MEADAHPDVLAKHENIQVMLTWLRTSTYAAPWAPVYTYLAGQLESTRGRWAADHLGPIYSRTIKMDSGHSAWLTTDDLPGVNQNSGLLFFCPELVQHISWNTPWAAGAGINIRCQCELKVQVRGRK